MICPKCKKQKTYHGFERRLITRGKNKGVYILTEYYSCECGLKCAKNTEQANQPDNACTLVTF